ncbi:MAG: rRNA maturation RNase YbeY [Lachnospiraceae bacterium]|nr:rRNA maturation RNase YbeY [Lachnospiraceae bacterium]
MTFYVEKETSETLGLDIEGIFKEVASCVLKRESCPFDCEINLTITDLESIRELNREHRGIDAATDVLSFPEIEWESEADYDGVDLSDPLLKDPQTGEVILGDIVICMEKVKAQAEEYGHSYKREFAFLIAHSMLHLLGFDHMEKEEEEVMFSHQKAALEELSISR